MRDICSFLSFMQFIFKVETGFAGFYKTFQIKRLPCMVSKKKKKKHYKKIPSCQIFLKKIPIIYKSNV